MLFQLLFGVTVLLIASATVSVPEVISVPADPSGQTAHVRVSDLGAGPLDAAMLRARAGSEGANASAESQVCYPSAFRFDPGTGSDVLDSSRLAGMRGSTLLVNAAQLTRSQLRVFVEENPRVVSELIFNPPSGTSTAAWWSELSVIERRTLEAGAPQLVGNLEGIPVVTRDRANRAYLEDSMRELTDRLEAGVGRGMQRNLLRSLNMLRGIEDALGTDRAIPERSLLTLETAYPGRAAIVLGDLETADYVSYVVPGMFISISEQIGDWTDAAARLYNEQASFEALFEEQATVATVAWIGYQTPHIVNVGSLDLAEEGADYLANSINGLRAIRAGSQPHISLLAHSYGSTAALIALSDGTTRVDSLALVGSPGSAAQNVSEIGVPADSVYVGEASWDPIVDSAFFGSDPGADSFGAKTLSVAGSIDRLTQEVLQGSTGHNEYFSPGTESMRNMSLIGIDKGEWVTDGSPRDSEKTLALGRE